jgi:predicted RNase H-like nuclease (RuvC/YqgF family)
MDKEIYVMKKKLTDRTMRMRELEVKVYDLNQTNKDLSSQLNGKEHRILELEKEVRRLHDIVYTVATTDLKPQFGEGNRLAVPNYKNQETYQRFQ